MYRFDESAPAPGIGSCPSLPQTNLFGFNIINETRQATLDWLFARLEANWPTRVMFLNAHCANLSVRSGLYREALARADAVLPDGSGISLALRMRGERLAANLNGTDLIPALCQRLSGTGHSVFLLGGRPGVADRAAASLWLTAPGLKIAGAQHGYFDPAEEDRVIRDINASGATLLLVAFGAPTQELWLHRNAPRLRATLTFGVGGLFDFLSGRIPRAPSWLRRAGLEWTYRLYQEPARMWRRYILGNPEFLARAAVDAGWSAGGALRATDLAVKRALDVFAAATGLCLLAPLLFGIAIAIRLTSKGPGLLRQTRIGKDGAPFVLYKFRSMYHDAEARRAALLADNRHGADCVTFKMARDPRITPIGRLLRRSSIDELPQLINVLNGAMSLVGPRPPLPAEVARYSPRELERLAGKPGLTGPWQVSGRADLPFKRQVELDIDYLARRNVLLDLAILVRTVPAVSLARGAY
jgi:exopolysaccharide biosynthesis WecB/TagA/CpsF family protein